jgi:hypothetical protein
MRLGVATTQSNAKPLGLDDERHEDPEQVTGHVVLVALTVAASVASAPRQDVSGQGQTFQALGNCKPELSSSLQWFNPRDYFRRLSHGFVQIPVLLQIEPKFRGRTKQLSEP